MLLLLAEDKKAWAGALMGQDWRNGEWAMVTQSGAGLMAAAAMAALGRQCRQPRCYNDGRAELKWAG